MGENCSKGTFSITFYSNMMLLQWEDLQIHRVRVIYIGNNIYILKNVFNLMERTAHIDAAHIATMRTAIDWMGAV